jgi:hypothetical protein
MMLHSAISNTASALAVPHDIASIGSTGRRPCLYAGTFPRVAMKTVHKIALARAAYETIHCARGLIGKRDQCIVTRGGLIMIASFGAPELNRLMNFRATVVDKRCSAGETQLKMRIGRGSAHINVVSDTTDVSFAPNIRKRDFIIPDTNEKKQERQSLVAPVTVLLGFDNISKTLVEIVGPVGFADGPPRLTSLCATPLNDSPFRTK